MYSVDDHANQYGIYLIDSTFNLSSQVLVTLDSSRLVIKTTGKVAKTGEYYIATA